MAFNADALRYKTKRVLFVGPDTRTFEGDYTLNDVIMFNMKYDITIHHVPSEDLLVSNLLAYISELEKGTVVYTFNIGFHPEISDAIHDAGLILGWSFN